MYEYVGSEPIGSYDVSGLVKVKWKGQNTGVIIVENEKSLSEIARKLTGKSSNYAKINEKDMRSKSHNSIRKGDEIKFEEKFGQHILQKFRNSNNAANQGQSDSDTENPNNLLNGVIKTFGDYALEKMKYFYDNRKKYEGTNLAPADRTPGALKTDCITYVLGVLYYAFNKTGDKAAVKAIKRLNANGVKIQNWLIKNRKWNVYYWNPDTCNLYPTKKDIADEKNKAQRTNSWGYYKQIKNQEKHHFWTNRFISRGQKYIGIVSVPKNNMLTDFSPLPGSACKKNNKALATLNSIQFGFGTGGGGYHTWLFRKGAVHEAHWSHKMGSDTIFEARHIVPLVQKSAGSSLIWGSGLIVVPPAAMLPKKNAAEPQPIRVKETDTI